MISLIWDRDKKQLVVNCTDDVEFIYMHKTISDNIEMISVEE